MTTRNTPKHCSLTKEVDSEMEQKVIQFHINILSKFLKFLPEAWRGTCKVGDHRLQRHHLPSHTASSFWWEWGGKHGTKNHTCPRQDPVTPAQGTKPCENQLWTPNQDWLRNWGTQSKMKMLGPVFKNYDEEFQDGNRSTFKQAQDPSELEPGVTALVISHDTGPATNQAK